ncbi:RNA polymerase sigma factor [Phototrophicus methaneseepsis]|uniref:RNA polymerase sigma factor n=1 Tax=Phototrophicus methaneseepsis TaxID=2710758 RepID=A0A7S8E759_9CHLR|nr:RNA polymerase sigma factor [Phototrophicus methaneseepsis]QPC81574.1 RNA polymerase sigma factor [Phototrophicus methaneseepsis]
MPEYSSPSDQPQPEAAQDDTLIARCIRGDQQSYADLYQRYADSVYRLCNTLLYTQEDAEDVVQESFVYAFRNIGRYDSQKASFKTWLFTIAISRCRNMYRRKQFLTVDLSAALQLRLAAPNGERPEAALARRDAREAVEVAVKGLPSQLREALVLRYAHGLTYREIAEIMDCPQKTAESRVRLAHKKLRKTMQGHGPALLEEILQI